MRKSLCAVLALLLAASLTACSGKSGTVLVERADMLSQASIAGDRYAGMVVSENVAKITRDADKTIQELYVTEGQEVTAGQKLFSYDSDELSLSKDRLQLEYEKMQKDKSTYASQLKDLQSQLSKTSDASLKLQLNYQIRSVQADQSQLEYDMKAKKQEIDKITEALKNVVVTSPVEGSIRKIDENNTDGSGTYITIQKSGAYRVKGTFNELSARGGITVGATVKIISRLDPTQTWTGTVTEIDTNNYEDGSSGDVAYPIYGGYDMGMMGGMNGSTSYPFYVELDSTEGLLLGQHVYVQVTSAGSTLEGLYVPQYYLVNLDTEMLTASMWVANSDNKLESRSVTLGAFDSARGAYEIVSGITAEDFVADPTAEGCAEGATVEYRQVPADLPTKPADSGEGDLPPEETDEANVDDPMGPVDTLPEDTVPEGSEVWIDDLPVVTSGDMPLPIPNPGE